jgi:hypothetical protein
MKKVMFGIAAALAIFAIVSCGSAPAPAAQTPEQKIEQEYKEIVETYGPQLILDGAKDYSVVTGDGLIKIAQKNWSSVSGIPNAGKNNGNYFPVFLIASPDSGIVDPDVIEIGTKLTIVDLKKNLDNPGARAAIKGSIASVAALYESKAQLPGVTDAKKSDYTGLAADLKNLAGQL